jgi:transposase
MAGRGEARVVVANRAQLSWDLINPDGWLAPDHRARLVVGFVETLDLTVLYAKIEAREGTAGRPAADPAVLFALWLLATMDGVGSARELDRLTSQDLAYRWVACGVPVNYHGLADFRVAHADVLDDLLTKTLAAFLAEGLFDADEIVVDGTKIKASAGKSSYKRGRRLDEAETAAKARVAALKAEVDADPAASSKRTQAARARGLSQTQERIEKARAKLAEIEAEKTKRAKRSPKEVAGKKEARASLTDPEARQMRCARATICRLQPRLIMASSLRSWQRTAATTVVWCGRCSRQASSGSGGGSNGCWRTPASPRLTILRLSAAGPKWRSASTFIRPGIATTSSRRRCWCGKSSGKKSRRSSRTGGSA